MKKIYILAAAALALTACDNNYDNPTSQVSAKITATIGEATPSRASGNSWAPGDNIGITLGVGESLRPHINIKYTTTDGGSEFTGNTLYFYNNMALTAYYPYAGEEGAAPGKDGSDIITASTPAENQTEENQPKIDFLWDRQTGITAAEGKVNFTFTHRMSKLTFTFIDSPATDDESEVDVRTMVSYRIEGLILDGTFDTFTGVCAAKSDGAEAPISIGVTGLVESEVALSPLIVFPQQRDNNKVKLHVYTDELKKNDPKYYQHYVCPLTFADGELKSGNEYKYTIQVTKMGLKVEPMKIVDWTTGQDVKLQATIE